MEFELLADSIKKINNKAGNAAKSAVNQLLTLRNFDNGTAFSDLTVLVCDFFLGSYPFSCFVIKYASGGNLDVRFGKQFPFTEYEVDVVIGLAFVMMQSRYTFHSVLLSEFVRKFFKHLLRVKGGVNLWQGND